MPTGLLQSFIPWIIYSVIAGSQYLRDEVAAIAAVIATLIFSSQNLRKKFILDLATLAYFILLAILYLLPIRTWLDQYAFILSNIVLAAIMWASIIIKKPFAMQYARQEVDDIFWLTPPFKHINYAISAVWALALSIMALEGFLQSVKLITSNIIADTVAAASLVVAIWFTRWFPSWYQAILFKTFSKKKDDSSKNPYLNGNYAPIKDEVSLDNLVIEGELPKDLRGIYMRNGPNPYFEPISYTYPIDGDGMLHAIYISDGKASYRNRFVETKGLIAEKKAGRTLYSGVARPIPVDPKLIGKDGDPGPIKDGAFIHIIRHAQRYLAMYESGPAYEVTEELRTIGEWCPKEAQRPFNMNAHTRLDPKTGELIAFTYQLNPPYLRYYIFDKSGNLTANVPIEKTYSSMMHDFVLTENYMVFFDAPAIFDFGALTKGRSLLSWRPEVGNKIILIHRQSHQIIFIDTELFFVYHFANGFEKDNQIIIDYARHEEMVIGTKLSGGKPPMLYRAIIDLYTKTVKHIQLNDHPVEFPRINERMNTQSNRYIYLPSKKLENIDTGNIAFHSVMKYDLQKQEAVLHDFGINMEIGETVFIPSTTSKAEDDGYVGLFVYNKIENKSDFVLLNAQNISDKPIAKIKLPCRVPHGLHGSWFDG